MSPGITLAVTTYNQGDLLSLFLDRYRAHGQGIPLLVVDDGSEDDTPARLEAAARHFPILRFRIAHGGSARGRNEALRRCPTPWIAFTDTDCLPDADYFRRLCEIPERFAGHAAVEGAVWPPPGPKPPFTHSVANLRGGAFFTANMAFRVADVLALGGFDEGFPLGLREDSDLALTLLEKRGPVPFWPEWKVLHPYLPRRFWDSVREAWRRLDRMVGAEIRLYRKHPDTYRLLRHRRSAPATLKAWCLHWAGLYLRECVAYWSALRPATFRSRAESFRLCAAAALVAAWEQGCILLICIARWKTARTA